MTSAALQREAFMPRSPGGMGPGLALALGVHVLLVVALAFSVNWRSSSLVVAEAELWGAVPQQAAPRAAEPEPPPPKPVAQPVKPPPPPVARPEPEPAKVPDAQIAIEKAKREKALEEKEKEKEDLARKKKEAAEERKAEAQRKEEARKAELARKEEEEMLATRERNLQRIIGQANATGAPDAKGTAQESKTISASYAGRIRAKVRPEIIFTESYEGNPVAEVEVRCAPDGKIISRKLLKSSGLKNWDEAVLRAIDKTEVFPLDEGRIPSSMTLVFSPRF